LLERPTLSFFLLASLCLGLRLALLPVVPVPQPHIHDEFSNLLAADTFLSGRLSNPPHPMWRHFETHIVLQHPTYASYRPPGQGLWLALGQLIFRCPWAAILLASALMCAVLYWALSGWIPRFWAFLMGLIAVFNLGLFSYWTNSYWGGSLTAVGGSLVFGATGRILRAAEGGSRWTGTYGLWFGLGLIPLMLTRPYEGSALVFGCAVVLAPALWGRRKDMTWIAAVTLPAVIIACALGGWILYYNYRVTGHSLQFPYIIGMNQYHVAGSFMWDTKLHPITYTNSDLERFFRETEAEQLKNIDTLNGKLSHLLQVLVVGMNFFARPILLIPMLFYSWKVLRSKRMRPALIIGAPLLAAIELAIWIWPHYDAPALGLIYLLIAQTLRFLWTLRLGGARVGRFLGVALVATALVLPFYPLIRNWQPTSWGLFLEASQRSEIKRQLENVPGNHLVLIRYPAYFNIHDEWVYNAADIDHSRIVWARSLDKASDRRLLNYYSNRHVWTVDLSTFRSLGQPFRLVRLCGPRVGSADEQSDVGLSQCLLALDLAEQGVNSMANPR
jgi:hypothetical protein